MAIDPELNRPLRTRESPAGQPEPTAGAIPWVVRSPVSFLFIFQHPPLFRSVCWRAFVVALHFGWNFLTTSHRHVTIYHSAFFLFPQRRWKSAVWTFRHQSLSSVSHRFPLLAFLFLLTSEAGPPHTNGPTQGPSLFP